MQDFSNEMEVAEKIALEGGAIMLEHFDGDLDVTSRPEGPVTRIDRQINAMVIRQLNHHFPQDGVIGEEASTAGYGRGRRWFCDAIDGTLAYIWGTPTAMFSLALVIDGLPAMGVAYDPFLKRMYKGIAGQPSTCNGTRLFVSHEDIKTGTVAAPSDLTTIFNHDPYVMSLINDHVYLAHLSGAVYKSCLIARGRLVGYVELGARPHDIAAAHLIVAGAGGTVTGLQGEALDYSAPFRGIVVSNGLTHENLLKRVALQHSSH
jgi:fructose-1,6-bisphosphatase/inositol monophosphatase family enzyme